MLNKMKNFCVLTIVFFSSIQPQLFGMLMNRLLEEAEKDVR